MLQKIHIAIGIILAIVYIYIYFNLQKLLPGFQLALETSGRRSLGLYIVLYLPVFSLLCFIAPNFLAEKLSPTSPFSGRSILSAGFWYLVGYFTLAVFCLATYILQVANAG